MGGVRPKKHLGQHFLGSEEVAIEVAEAIPNDKNVLEIGPGLGALTEHIISKCKTLTLIELDSELALILKKRFAKPHVKIINGDALQLDFSKFDAVAGLLPYNISSQIVERLVNSKCKTGIFVVQKELGQRMVASPGTRDYSRFSVLVQNNFNAELLSVYPTTVFWPEPKVESALVILQRHKPIELEQKVVDALFQHKNQKVSKALKHSRHLLGERTAPQRLASKRVVELTLEQLHELSHLK